MIGNQDSLNELKMRIKQKKLNKGQPENSTSSILVTPSKPQQTSAKLGSNIGERSATGSDSSSDGKNKYGGV